jgi:hypothetical protein
MCTQITAVTFDADDTLWDFEATMRDHLGICGVRPYHV